MRLHGPLPVALRGERPEGGGARGALIGDSEVTRGRVLRQGQVESGGRAGGVRAGGGDGAGEALSLPPPQPAMEAIRTREPRDTERRMNGVVVGACDMAAFG